MMSASSSTAAEDAVVVGGAPGGGTVATVLFAHCGETATAHISAAPAPHQMLG